MRKQHIVPPLIPFRGTELQQRLVKPQKTDYNFKANTETKFDKFLPSRQAVYVNARTVDDSTATNNANESFANQSISTNAQATFSDNVPFRVFGSSNNEKLFIFTGTVERIIKWHKIFMNHLCYYEVIAPVVSIQEGSVRTQKIMLLRDRKGPILQVTYYTSTHIDLEDFVLGMPLRCVGRMIGSNILSAFSIRAAQPEKIASLQRMCYICDHAITHFLTNA